MSFKTYNTKLNTALPEEFEKVQIIEGQHDGADLSIAVAVAKWNSEVTFRLRDGALKAMLECGGQFEGMTVAYCPGCFELPILVSELCSSGLYDAVVALGCVVKGETPHFDFVAGTCATSLSRIALDSHIPIAFGVLTVDTFQQAVDRAADNSTNKGYEAMLTAIETVHALTAIPIGGGFSMEEMGEEG